MNEDTSSVPQPSNASSRPTLGIMVSCLRDPAKNSGGTVSPPQQRVTFPDEESNLITGYMEPANPWENADCESTGELVSIYEESCRKHSTEPLPKVIAQIQTLDLSAERNESLRLTGEPLTPLQLEPLEEVLRRVQFTLIDVEGAGLGDEAAASLFDMLEYYESAVHLNISGNSEISSRGWHACSRMLKKTQCLERLDARGVQLNEQHMPILARALRISTQLQVLKLENCWLSGRPIIILAAALRLNTGVKELYLADNELGVTDAVQLGNLLRSNTTLQLLDVSNNDIQDSGIGHISDGLIDQAPSTTAPGLGMLVVWNNGLTRNCSKHVARTLALSKTLAVLNIGRNVLTNECVHVMKDALTQNRVLLRLGMQSTHITSEGAIALAECLADHPVIQRVDLRDNSVGVAGLMALTLALKVNASVTQLDIDSAPKKMEASESEQYRRLALELAEYCLRNERAPAEDLDTVEGAVPPPERRNRLSSLPSRKISLTCETQLRTAAVGGQRLAVEPRRGAGGRLRSPAPSPIPSPVSSPLPSPSRTRFSVVKVAETSTSPSRTFFPSPSNSRFHVSRVETDPCQAAVTLPSGANVTMGFTTVPAIPPTTRLIPQICVGDRTDSPPTPPNDEADAEVRRILSVPDVPAAVEVAWQSNGKIPASVSADQIADKPLQRTRKISRIENVDEKIPTSLEKLIGLFNPGIFFNKAQQPLKPETAAMLQQVAASRSQEAADCAKHDPETECLTTDVVNNNNDDDDALAATINGLMVSEDESCLDAARKEDENSNVRRLRDGALQKQSRGELAGSLFSSGSTEDMDYSSAASNSKSSIDSVGSSIFGDSAFVNLPVKSDLP